MHALNGKVVIVTGGSSGIGRAAALSFARQGANVVITARRAAPLEETAAHHPNIVGLVADAAAPHDAVRTIEGGRHMGPPGCAGEQCRRGCHPPAGRRHGRSDHEDPCRERAWSKPARHGGASLSGGGEGDDRQCIEHVRPQVGCRALPLRRQQGGPGAPDPLLGRWSSPPAACASTRSRRARPSRAR